MKGAPIETPAGPVDLVDDQPLEIDLATTLLYGASHYSYRQIAPPGRLARTRRAATRSSPWAPGIAAATTNCCASSPPARACASTS